MKREITAELFWVLRRHAICYGGLASMVVLIAVLVEVAISSSGDVAGAVARAEELANEAAHAGFDLSVASAYIEPRFLLANELPSALAQVGLALAIIGLITSSLSVGGEWRSGTVALSFVNPRRRAGPVLVRIGVWTILWLALSVIILLLACAGLVGIAHATGDPNGIPFLTISGLLFRATLVASLGALLGGAWSTITRSNTVVVVAALVYLLVFEIIMAVIVVGTTLRTPATILAQFVTARIIESAHVLPCGAPRCDDVYATHAGSWIVYVVLVVLAALSMALAAVSARRNVVR